MNVANAFLYIIARASESMMAQVCSGVRDYVLPTTKRVSLIFHFFHFTVMTHSAPLPQLISTVAIAENKLIKRKQLISRIADIYNALCDAIWMEFNRIFFHSARMIRHQWISNDGEKIFTRNFRCNSGLIADMIRSLGL